MRRILLAAVLTALSPAALSAQTADPQAVKAGTYTVDGAHTQAEFSVSHLGFNPYSGIVGGEASGTLVLDPADLSKTQVDVTLPVSTLRTTSDVLTEELTGADWLDAEQFPDMRFQSTAVTRTGDTSARIDGNLTLHGVTRPVTLDATFTGQGVNPMTKAYTVGFTAAGSIQRSAFGVDEYVPMISDEVTITLSAAFEQK